MRFTPQFLDELRARLPVSEVVGRRVKLRKQGREFIGLSPFNKEKSPSFTVNDQKGFFHDFSSGKHGDIFGFVMETEGVAFPEAVERLAQLAGVALPKVSHEDEQRDARRKTLHDVMELAAKFFEATDVGLISVHFPALGAFSFSHSPNRCARYSFRCSSPRGQSRRCSIRSGRSFATCFFRRRSSSGRSLADNLRRAIRWADSAFSPRGS